MSKAIPIGISLPEDLLKELDEVRGDLSRSSFIKRAVESRLKKAKRVDLEL